MHEQTKPSLQRGTSCYSTPDYRNNTKQHSIIKKLAKHSRIIKTTLKLRLIVISVHFQQKPILQDDITLLKQGAYNFQI
jgi:hypothetical protein